MSRQGTFVPEIQALRAVAVLLVMIYHSGLSLPGGFIGVDVFFVISGYLITSLLWRELRATGGIDLPAFFSRRARRLVPAAILVVSVSLAGAWLFYSPLEFKQFTSSAIATAVYVSNVWFAYLATDYLAADGVSNPLLHTWSLSVEEQFYLLWPLLMVLFFRIGKAPNHKATVLAGLAAICVVSFAACIVLTYKSQPIAFFGSPMRAWEFGAGGLLAVYGREFARVSIHQRRLLLAMGLGTIVACALMYSDRTVFPGFAALPPVAATVLIIAFCSGPPGSIIAPWMRHSLLQYTGNISYSLYLWHWPILAVIDRLGDLPAAVKFASYMGASFILAALTYHFVENRFRFSRILSTRPSLSLASAVMLSVVCAGCAFAMRAASIDALSDDRQIRYLQAAEDLPGSYRDGCHLPFATVMPPHCVYGIEEAESVVVLFGDSHAAQWLPALRAIAHSENIAVVSLTKSGCPSVEFEPFNIARNRQYTECTQWRIHAINLIKKIRPQLVVVSNSSAHVLDQQEHSVPDTKRRWRSSVQAVVRKLSVIAGNVALIRDTPVPGYNVPECLSHAAWRGMDSRTACAYSTRSPEATAVFEIEKELVEDVSNGVAIDMSMHICARASGCPTEVGEMVQFMDSNHLSATFSRYLAGPLLAELGSRRLLAN